MLVLSGGVLLRAVDDGDEAFNPPRRRDEGDDDGEADVVDVGEDTTSLPPKKELEDLVS
jgi:hypothetical protein